MPKVLGQKKSIFKEPFYKENIHDLKIFMLHAASLEKQNLLIALYQQLNLEASQEAF